MYSLIRLTFDLFDFNKKVYICSIHGLIRGENMELGRDSDTGGQVVFSFFFLIYSKC